MVADEYCREVQGLVPSEVSRAALRSTLYNWDTTSRLLRHQCLSPALVRGASLDDIAAAATVALHMTLRMTLRVYSCGRMPAGPLAALEGITAAAYHCGLLVEAFVRNRLSSREAAPGSQELYVPMLAWEGMATCCAALQALLRGAVVSDILAEGDEASGRLKLAMTTLGGLLDGVARVIDGAPGSQISTVQAAGAAAAAYEAAVRLCGRLWQSAEQLAAAVGRSAVLDLGRALDAALRIGPQALAAALDSSPSVPEEVLHAMTHLVTSLAKRTLLLPLAARHRFCPLQLAAALHQLRVCTVPFATAASRALDKTGSDGLPGLLAQALALSFANTFPAAVQAACSTQGRSVLASCAGELSRLALDIKFYQGHGWPDINTGLGVLATDAVREATAGTRVTVQAREVLEGVHFRCCHSDFMTDFIMVSPAVYLVESGMLEHLVTWARRAQAPADKVVVVQQRVLEAALVIADVLLREWERQHVDGTPTLKFGGKAWGNAELARWSSSLRGSQQVNSKAFWKQEVGVVLLPALEALAAQIRLHLPAMEGCEQQEAAALALLACANPVCTNVHGCSEARLRHRRCSGCRAVHYCSTECQGADFGRHARVCGQLAARHASAQ